MKLEVLGYFFPLTDFVGGYLEEMFTWHRVPPAELAARGEEAYELLVSASSRSHHPLPSAWLEQQTIRCMKKLLSPTEQPLVQGTCLDAVLAEIRHLPPDVIPRVTRRERSSIPIPDEISGVAPPPAPRPLRTRCDINPTLNHTNDQCYSQHPELRNTRNPGLKPALMNPSGQAPQPALLTHFRNDGARADGGSY